MAPAVSGRVRAGVVVALVALLGAFVLGRITGDDGAREGQQHHLGASAPADADVTFAQQMAQHHDQALLMATLAVDRATPSVRGIALSILGTQAQEVGLLRGWLRLWGAPGVPATSSDPTGDAGDAGDAGDTGDMGDMDGMEGMDHGDMEGMDAMPGMASPSQLDRLYRLHGKRFDVLFLQLMIRHHQGGLIMTQGALKTTSPTVREAARTMGTEQLEDLATMTALLSADGAKPLPAPQ